ncbi:hypothetical protein HPB49_017694 [Dermacentor silvarum]|uniref:Uncharacterized protein n=1 Tax=Dermacentor silvarum TaxID=543639 RepID=A0ACB8E158_DERSI|nr:hypothetical protein HPB49_017694 [Dermacentor silvarum]
MNPHQTARALLFLCAVLSSLVGFASAVAVTKVLASKFLPSVSDLITSPDLSITCSASLVKLLLGLKNKDAWAMKMILSNGFLPSNIFEGGQGRTNPLTRTTYNKFASTDYRIGICTPSTCTTEDLQVLATKMLGQYGINSTVRSCRTDNPKTITKLQAASM